MKRRRLSRSDEPHAYRCLRWGVPDDITADELRVIYYKPANAARRAARAFSELATVLGSEVK
jgi:hypothetical protein